jgi:glycosyltransferase involved in cell wall biosynthesis
VRSTLLYDPNRPTSIDFLRGFDAAFPIVDLAAQVEHLEADVSYIHRFEDPQAITDLARLAQPAFRFFHDHRPFCPREHKYTLLTRTTCQRRVGPHCLGCLGYLHRGERGLRLRSPFEMRRSWQSDRRLTGYVVASDYMAHHVADHGFDAHRIHKIPLYATDLVEPRHSSRRPELLLFVGNLITGKGPDLLLDALSRMRHVSARLVLLGDGPQRPALERQAQSLGLGDRVDFLGRRTPTELNRWYRQATCLVVPSRSPETFALVGPEAMRFGTPVVATAVGGVGEWLQHERTGLLVPAGDSPALAAALDRLLSEPRNLALYGQRAKASFEARFRPRHHLDQLLALFRGSRRKAWAA